MKVWLFNPSPTIKTTCDFTWRCDCSILHPLSKLPVTLHEGVTVQSFTHYQNYLWLRMKVWLFNPSPSIKTTCGFAWRCDCSILHPVSKLPVASHEGVSTVKKHLLCVRIIWGVRIQHMQVRGQDWGWACPEGYGKVKHCRSQGLRSWHKNQQFSRTSLQQCSIPPSTINILQLQLFGCFYSYPWLGSFSKVWMFHF